VLYERRRRLRAKFRGADGKPMIEPCQETRAKLTRPAVSLHEGSAQLSKFTGPTSPFGINSVRSMRPHKVSQVSDSATMQAQQQSSHTGTERDEEMLLPNDFVKNGNYSPAVIDDVGSQNLTLISIVDGAFEVVDYPRTRMY